METINGWHEHITGNRPEHSLLRSSKLVKADDGKYLVVFQYAGHYNAFVDFYKNDYSELNDIVAGFTGGNATSTPVLDNDEIGAYAEERAEREAEAQKRIQQRAEEEAERREFEKIAYTEAIHAAAAIPALFAGATFDNYEIRGNAKDIERAKAWVNNDDTFLTLAGNVGLGKTHIACAIAHTLLEADVPVIFITAAKILSEFIRRFNKSDNEAYRDRVWYTDPESYRIQSFTTYNLAKCRTADELMDTLCNVDVLIIDDLGAENGTTWAASQLDMVINERYSNMKRTIFTVNSANAIPDRAKSRMLSGTRIILDGDDYRKSQGNKTNMVTGVTK